MIAVMGASGNTGGRIVRRLLDGGESVRALARSADKLAPLQAAGAEIAAGDAADRTFLGRAFEGADGVYILIPPDVTADDYRALQDRQGEAIASAVTESGVRTVVFLSSLGAELPEGTGPIAGLHAQEERLRALAGVNVLVLRAAYFFENFRDALPMIKHQGVNGGAIAPDLVLPMIAARDIADVAAEALRTRAPRGAAVRELLGARDLTHAEATRIIGERIGRPDLQYVQMPYEQYEAMLVQVGLSTSAASMYTDLARALNAGRIQSLEGRNPANTTPTRFEDFAEALAAEYAAL